MGRLRWTDVQPARLYPNNGPLRHEDVYPGTKWRGCHFMIRAGKHGERLCRLAPEPDSDYCTYHNEVLAERRLARLKKRRKK